MDDLMEHLVEYIEHAFIHISTRRIVIRDEEGYTEEYRYDFDEKGMESYSDMVNLLQDFLEPDELTFVF
ncbi:MAG: hypothetical protein CL921_00220 [Deltaproteobacteria bacterium]|jgi:hypothetical protein|nr:hypothetical protein [Deltaproteobacteria bacterium]|tara:strand:+ start:126 stop:332 length:207 start_codon:yes stop_codon:yes gene_type:complete